jgi:hypothetical protein
MVLFAAAGERPAFDVDPGAAGGDLVGGLGRSTAQVVEQSMVGGDLGAEGTRVGKGHARHGRCIDGPAAPNRHSGVALIDGPAAAAQIAAVATSTAQILRWGTFVAIGAAVVGILVLLAQAASEVVADPSLTLEDGYWIGRLPWTSVGVGLVVAGATATNVLGYTLVMLRGGILRRFLGAIAVVPAAFWWTVELLQMQGVSGASCQPVPCPRTWIDPITNAYSQPDWTIKLLILPAIIVAALALAPHRRPAPIRSRTSPGT